jgi:hypothetical protein
VRRFTRLSTLKRRRYLSYTALPTGINLQSDAHSFLRHFTINRHTKVSSMSELMFYTHPTRGRSTGLKSCTAHQTVWLSYGEEMKSASYLAVNPMARFRLATQRGTVVTLSRSNSRQLVDCFPGDKQLILPVGDARRASYFRWLFFCRNN